MTDQEEPLYSVAQQAALTLLPAFTGSLSVFGSIAIVYIILQDRKKKLTHVYHRIVFTMSCLDIFNSANYALSALVVPKGTPNVWGAQGTIATCSASGFMMQLGIAVPLYSGCLALYYLMMIRYRVKERVIAKWVEPFMHIISFGYPFVTAIIPLLYEMYNPMTTMVGWCFLADYPMNCSNDPDVDCLRGENYNDLMLYSTMLPVTSNFLLIIVCMVLISWYVWRQGRNTARWTLKQSGVNHSRETAKQGALYIFFFWLTFIWQLAIIFSSKEETSENRSFYFGFVVMIKIFLPLQGFWNFFIYVRPRYNAVALTYPNDSSFAIFKSLFTGRIGDEPVVLSRFGSRPMQRSSAADRASVTTSAAESTSFGTRRKPSEANSDAFTPELQPDQEEDRTQNVDCNLEPFAEEGP